MDLFELQIKLNDLVQNWDKYLDDFIQAIEPDLIDVNTDQLDKSIDSKGKKFPAYANPDYAKLKGRKFPDLKLTGDFRSDFFVDYFNDKIYIDSKDEKTEKLVGQYGEDLFGLTESNLNKLIKEQILPDFIYFIQKKLGI